MSNPFRCKACGRWGIHRWELSLDGGSRVPICRNGCRPYDDYLGFPPVTRPASMKAFALRTSDALAVELCPCGCGHDINDRQGQLTDVRHSELVFQGLPPLPGFVPGVGHGS